jgi:hypothetical protein
LQRGELLADERRRFGFVIPWGGEAIMSNGDSVSLVGNITRDPELRFHRRDKRQPPWASQ